jgi:hypothetical protein
MIRADLRGVKEWTDTLESLRSSIWTRGKEPAMAMKITYPDGSVEIIPDAIRVDEQNFHEGMYDFYDERRNLLKQIDMGSGIRWEIIGADE